MGKPEEPEEGEATASTDKSAPSRGISERRDVILQYINYLRIMLKRLRDKLH